MSDDSLSDDCQLFREAAGDVKPLTARKKVVPQQPGLRSRFSPHDDAEEDRFSDEPSKTVLATHLGEVAPVPPESPLAFVAAHSMSKKQLQQLREGRLHIDGTVDLHGYRIDQAYEILNNTLFFALEQKHRVVRVVHGKSLGKMKGYVQAWLKGSPHVLAFSSCIPRHGGTGALYVLLRRR